MVYVKFIKIFTAVFLFVFFGLTNAQGSNDSLIGVWQDSRLVASGWTNTFLFFKDGSFKFFYNQMDCSKRIVSYSGKWKVNEDELDLNVKKKAIIEGGHLELSNGSCASDSMIVGGVEKVVKLKPPEEIIYSLSEVYSDNQDDIPRIKIYIDAMPYWKFSDNPGDLLNEFEQ
jgi:hypothetical protein